MTCLCSIRTIISDVIKSERFFCLFVCLFCCFVVVVAVFSVLQTEMIYKP